MQTLRQQHVDGDLPDICANCTEYPTDAAAPRFSTKAEASTQAPHLALPHEGRTPRPHREAEA